MVSTQGYKQELDNEIDALRSCYFDVIKILTYLFLIGKNHVEQSEAKNLLYYFKQFLTVILIIIQSKLLEAITIVSKMMQDPREGIEKSVEMLSSLPTQFQALRNN